MKIFCILQIIVGGFIALTAASDIQFIPGIMMVANGISFLALYLKK